jgi:hypothetical protein
MTPPMNAPSNTQNASRLSLTERLEPTSSPVSAAHDAHVRSAIESVRWERRGLLGRLTRTDG